MEAFERINTIGVKLKRADVVSAHVSAKHSGFIADEVVPFVSKLHERGFARLEAGHLFRACSFIATPEARIRAPLSELTGGEVTQAWDRNRIFGAPRKPMSSGKSVGLSSRPRSTTCSAKSWAPSAWAENSNRSRQHRYHQPRNPPPRWRTRIPHQRADRRHVIATAIEARTKP